MNIVGVVSILKIGVSCDVFLKTGSLGIFWDSMRALKVIFPNMEKRL